MFALAPLILLARVKDGIFELSIEALSVNGKMGVFKIEKKDKGGVLILGYGFSIFDNKMGIRGWIFIRNTL